MANKKKVKKVKLFKFKTSEKINEGLNTSLYKIGGAAGGGMGYRFAKNMAVKDMADTDKASKVQELITVGAVGIGAAGIIAAENSILESTATGMFAVATVDLVNSLGTKVENVIGVSLGELPAQKEPTKHIIVEADEPTPMELPAPEYDPLEAEIDNILSEMENAPVTIKGTQHVDVDDLDNLIDKIN